MAVRKLDTTNINEIVTLTGSALLLITSSKPRPGGMLRSDSGKLN